MPGMFAGKGLRMTGRCRHCQGTGREPDHLADLRDWCEARHVPILPGDRVSEHAAAQMLGRADGTLRNWAYADRPIPFVTVRGRRTYRLADIAAMIQSEK